MKKKEYDLIPASTSLSKQNVENKHTDTCAKQMSFDVKEDESIFLFCLDTHFFEKNT